MVGRRNSVDGRLKFSTVLASCRRLYAVEILRVWCLNKGWQEVSTCLVRDVGGRKPRRWWRHVSCVFWYFMAEQKGWLNCYLIVFLNNLRMVTVCRSLIMSPEFPRRTNSSVIRMMSVNVIWGKWDVENEWSVFHFIEYKETSSWSRLKYFSELVSNQEYKYL